jgi:hypothetical protein
MKVHTFKNLLAAMALICLVPAANAQFDDVYYDPDNVDPGYNSTSYDDPDADAITYYDDDEYEYYDDYDYYYSSRIRRFHQPYRGFDFYDPCYVSFSYYDPFYYDAYYYPGASIYISFGDADYWGYRNWRRWSRWNRYSHWNNWCTPASYYYSYNSWCAPSYNYWGGYHGYHSYSNYYNNYYNSCPLPVSNYYGVNHGTVTVVNQGGSRGSYYGPRIAGNTGSSPRGPIIKPENVQPVMKGSDSGVTQSNDKPSGLGDGTKPGSVTRSNPVSIQPGEEKTPANLPVTRNDQPSDVVKEIPVDKELKRNEVTPTSRRPVFKPYPSGEESKPSTDRPNRDNPSYTPRENNPSTRDSYTPRSNDRSGSSPSQEESKPQYQPTPRSYDDRPRYTPPPSRNRQEEEKPSYTPRNNEDRPSYSPPSRNNEREDRPTYTPSPRNNDSGRSNDRPSYSPPPSRNDSPSSGRSSSSPSRENSSSGSSRSSSSESPRSRG